MLLFIKCTECEWEGELENAAEYDEEGEPKFFCPECRSQSLVEKMSKGDWQTRFEGMPVDLKRAIENGWSDQGGSNPLFGVKRDQNILAKIMTPANQCSSHQIWIFLIVRLDDDHCIEDVDYRVDHVFPDGSGRTISVGLFPPDIKNAEEELRYILPPDK